MAKNGHQIWQMAEVDLLENIHNGSADGSTLVFTAGMSSWTAVAEIPQLATRTDARHPPAPPLPPGRTAYEIDFAIEGTETQYVEVELDPGESAVAEAGAMMYMTGGIGMETIFGDGGTQQQSGVMNKLLTGESLFMTVLATTVPASSRWRSRRPTQARFSRWSCRSSRASSSVKKTPSYAPRRGYPSASPSRKRSAWDCSVAKGSSCNVSRATASPSCTRVHRPSRGSASWGGLAR